MFQKKFTMEMFKFSIYIMFPIGSLWLFHELDFIEGFAGTRKLYEDLIKPKDDLFVIYIIKSIRKFLKTGMKLTEFRIKLEIVINNSVSF